MIKRICVQKYRKLENMDLELSKGINVISGTNGTCKTSLLHIISNAYQAVNKKCKWIHDPSCLDVIKQINSSTNPKIEALTKGDKTYNDPADGVKGVLFTVEYYGHAALGFRKHNSKLSNRYAVKPLYRPGTMESLPFCPVIYLGLTRLYPFGEYLNDDAVKKLEKNLPPNYQKEIANIYKLLVGINITAASPQKMGDIKTRADFESDQTGIDSNTISAGEDNLFIIISALVSLRYYYENIVSSNEVESILLIDEFDATLHPSLQFKLLDVFREYSEKYKIQVILTTHSLSSVEYALKKKDNVIYLIDNITSVINMDSPDIYKIKMFLQNQTQDDIYLNKAIPLFTEDNEARIFLNIIFDYFEEKEADFPQVRRFFHYVKANIGSENLRAIFSDSYLLKSTMKYVCILDGDQHTNLDHYTITLPGGASPEKVIMDYAIFLYDNDSDFWTAPTILELNYGKMYFRDNIKPDIDHIHEKLKELRDASKKTHGVERDLRKRAFTKHQRFFELLFKQWLNDSENTDAINKFYKNLNIMFKRVAEFYGINPHIWNIN